MTWPRLVVFDLGGTLVEDDGAVKECFQEVLAEHGVRASEEQIQAVRGRSKQEAISRLLADRQVGADEVRRVYERFILSLVGAFSRNPPGSREGAGELLRSLQEAGVSAVLTTGFPRRVVEPILETQTWKALLNHVLTADDVAASRPDPALIFEAMRRSSISSADDVANIGDTETDMLAGAAASVRLNIALAGGAHTRRRLEASPASHVVDSLAEALAVIRSETP